MKLEVTERQLQVIRDSVEAYGRMQIGQFGQLAEIITQTGWQGYGLTPRQGETAEHRKEREKRDEIVCNVIKNALEGIYHQVYMYDEYRHTVEADIALDIWAKLDRRRVNDNFVMGTEPPVKVYGDDGVLLEIY